MTRHVCHLAIAALLLLAGAGDVAANLMLREPFTDTATVGLHLSHPSNNVFQTSTLSGSLELDASIPLSRSASLILQVPVATYDDERIDRVAKLGNISVGFDLAAVRSQSQTITWTILATLPSVSQEYMSSAEANVLYRPGRIAMLLGHWADFYDFTRFQPYYWGLYNNFSLQYKTTYERLGWELGPTVLIPREDGDDTEMLVHFGFSMGMGPRTWQVVLECGGLFIATEDTRRFLDRLDTFFAVGLELDAGIVRPTIYYQRAFDSELTDRVSNAVHIDLDFRIGQGKN